MDKEHLLAMIHSPEHENEYWDFKQQWYEKTQKSELARDVISFANTAHHQDCYLIIGVTDDQRVIGVEHDENRKNKQQLQNFIRDLPFAQNTFPQTDVQTYHVEGHEVDVITIFDSDQVPFFLAQPYRKGNTLGAGAIYCRNNDSNTPINATATDHEAELLWRKRFHEDMEIMDHFEYILGDYTHWEYVENNEYIGFLYKINPDYQIILKDTTTHNAMTAYSSKLDHARLVKRTVQFRYRNILIKEITSAWLNDGKLLVPVPEIATLTNFDVQYDCYYLLRHSLAYKFLYFVYDVMHTKAENDIAAFLASVVIADDHHDLTHKLDTAKQALKQGNLTLTATSSEVAELRSHMSMDFSNNNHEMQTPYLQAIIKQLKLAHYLNNLPQRLNFKY